MPKFIEVEAWVVVDADENWVAAESEEALAERYNSEVGNDSHIARRVLCVKLKVPVPETVELTAEVGPEGAVGELKVA